ncbi:hypothetical protein QR680_003781 [Steinernema hermaphroditum]|uniref:C2H2-type domain-containing protein n=1 Tax=Steinernema hermaphroditum TaxID=289476 RepID=A0AA39HNS9_9BILA|nr:hypothetical protein QR680_003781 [Steinernema hermaphroditum]
MNIDELFPKPKRKGVIPRVQYELHKFVCPLCKFEGQDSGKRSARDSWYARHLCHHDGIHHLPKIFPEYFEKCDSSVAGHDRSELPMLFTNATLPLTIYKKFNIAGSKNWDSVFHRSDKDLGQTITKNKSYLKIFRYNQKPLLIGPVGREFAYGQQLSWKCSFCNKSVVDQSSVLRHHLAALAHLSKCKDASKDQHLQELVCKEVATINKTFKTNFNISPTLPTKAQIFDDFELQGEENIVLRDECDIVTYQMRCAVFNKAETRKEVISCRICFCICMGYVKFMLHVVKEHQLLVPPQNFSVISHLQAIRPASLHLDPFLVIENKDEVHRYKWTFVRDGQEFTASNYLAIVCQAALHIYWTTHFLVRRMRVLKGFYNIINYEAKLRYVLEYRQMSTEHMSTYTMCDVCSERIPTVGVLTPPQSAFWAHMLLNHLPFSPQFMRALHEESEVTAAFYPFLRLDHYDYFFGENADKPFIACAKCDSRHATYEELVKHSRANHYDDIFRCPMVAERLVPEVMVSSSKALYGFIRANCDEEASLSAEEEDFYVCIVCSEVIYAGGDTFGRCAAHIAKCLASISEEKLQHCRKICGISKSSFKRRLRPRKLEKQVLE